jgi:phenylacetic acid degradation operon negative regulatory protein
MAERKDTGMKARSMLFTLYGDYVRHFGGTIGSGSLVKLMGELSFSPGAVRTALSRTCQQGWLKVTRDGKNSFYSLTKHGEERMEEAARRIFHLRSGNWDGQWTVTTYGHPEKKSSERGQLRRELQWLGFGRMIPGVWISPNPLGRVALNHLRVQGLQGAAEVFTARHLGNASREDLVRRCWNIPMINRSYERFIREWQPRWDAFQNAVTRGGEIADRLCFADKTLLVHEYRKFLFVDPGLPAELLPRQWAGTAAWRLFRDYYQLLGDGAIRFFESVYKAPSCAIWDPVRARQQALESPFGTSWQNEEIPARTRGI